jgi:hypothetical protein
MKNTIGSFQSRLDQAYERILEFKKQFKKLIQSNKKERKKDRKENKRKMEGGMEGGRKEGRETNLKQLRKPRRFMKHSLKIKHVNCGDPESKEWGKEIEIL